MGSGVLRKVLVMSSLAFRDLTLLVNNHSHQVRASAVRNVVAGQGLGSDVYQVFF